MDKERKGSLSILATLQSSGWPAENLVFFFNLMKASL